MNEYIFRIKAEFWFNRKYWEVLRLSINSTYMCLWLCEKQVQEVVSDISVFPTTFFSSFRQYHKYPSSKFWVHPSSLLTVGCAHNTFRGSSPGGNQKPKTPWSRDFNPSIHKLTERLTRYLRLTPFILRRKPFQSLVKQVGLEMSVS